MAKQFEEGKQYRFSTKAFIDCMGFYPSEEIAELEGEVVYPQSKHIGICEDENVHRDWCEEIEKPKHKDETIEIRKNGRLIYEGRGQVKIERSTKHESYNSEEYDRGESIYRQAHEEEDLIYLKIKRGDDR